MLIKLTPWNNKHKEFWIESSEIIRIERTSPPSDSVIIRPKDDADNVTFIQAAGGVFPVEETPAQIVALIKESTNG